MWPEPIARPGTPSTNIRVSDEAGSWYDTINS